MLPIGDMSQYEVFTYFLNSMNRANAFFCEDADNAFVCGKEKLENYRVKMIELLNRNKR